MSGWRMRRDSSWSRRSELVVLAAAALAHGTTKMIGLKPRYRCSSRLSICFQRERTRGYMPSDVLNVLVFFLCFSNLLMQLYTIQ